jgi:phage terminase large subunit-like protein
MSFLAFCRRLGLDLEPFQRRIVRAVTSGEREIVALLPRGQGKTSLMSLIALHHLTTVEDAKVVVAAASRQQATHLFEYAERYARELGDPHVVPRHLVLRWCPHPDTPKIWTRSLEVWASDARKLHGLTPSLAIIDELQAHADQSVYIALNSALHKRARAQLVTISTAGQGGSSPLGLLRARALALPSVKRQGAVTEARGTGLRFLEWSVAGDADVDDPRVVKRANPASWITVEQLAHARASLPDLAHRRFVANQWTEQAGHSLPPAAWQACVGKPVFEPGERIYAAVDLGGQDSSTALVWVNERLHVGAAIYEGEDGLLEAQDHIRELATTYTLAEVTFDPWHAQAIAAELEREGLVTTAFPQHDSRMCPASGGLYDAIIHKRLVLPDDSILATHAANAIARHGRRGWRIDRPPSRPHIDGIIALAMCVDIATHRPEPVKLLGWL